MMKPDWSFAGPWYLTFGCFATCCYWNVQSCRAVCFLFLKKKFSVFPLRFRLPVFTVNGFSPPFQNGRLIV